MLFDWGAFGPLFLWVNVFPVGVIICITSKPEKSLHIVIVCFISLINYHINVINEG